MGTIVAVDGDGVEKKDALELEFPLPDVLRLQQQVVEEEEQVPREGERGMLVRGLHLPPLRRECCAPALLCRP
jgi:hypothetical protein